MKKKLIAIFGGLIVCMALILLILSKSEDTTVDDVEIPTVDNEQTEIVVIEPTITPEIVVEPIEIQETEPEKDVNGDDQGTEQTIQPDVEEKPTYTEEQLSDPTQTPSGEPVEVPTEDEEVAETESTQSTTTSTEQSTSNGSTDGKTYVPGFGWIENSGENTVVPDTSQGDINTQVGIMG
ncbi:MAG: DUF6550 family protein [Clostridia bacterium]